MSERIEAPTRAELDAVFRDKYGPPQQLGQGPALRLRHGYFTPDDCYEALLARLVTARTRWLEVGCGRHLLPNNAGLARTLADRAALLVGVDPDPTVAENPYLHERVTCAMEDWDGGRRFDLVTLRMVAEHVDDPPRLVASIARALAPGGLAVVYTVDRFAPGPLLTTIVPLGLRHPIKRWLWRTERKDTFPTRFRMNTRARLRALFAAHGCTEVGFLRLDDCRTFARFKVLLGIELCARRALRAVGLRYPESCLLGVYRAP
jgi:SAM-dependent methyltransferase